MTQEVPNTKINWKSKTHNHSHCYMLKQREQIKGMVNFGEKKKLSFLFLCPSIKFSLRQIKIKNYIFHCKNIIIKYKCRKKFTIL